MSKSESIGHRFELASKRLFKEIFPRLGFELIDEPDTQRGGAQFGFDLRLEARPKGSDVIVRFFIECKGASKIGPLPIEEFNGKPEQLHLSRFNPDYWILFSPLRYLTNDFSKSLQHFRLQYPFALVDWTRKESEKEAAGMYLDLFKHFPDIYAVFKADIEGETRDTPPQCSLAEILEKLQSSLRNAYGSYWESDVESKTLPFVRRITPYTVYREKNKEYNWLNAKKAYFHLDSSFQTVFPLVCRGEVVRSPELEARICREIENPAHQNASLAVLGSEGCGKSTLLLRLAVDYALKGFPVLVMDTVIIDQSLHHANYESFFKKIHTLHNAGVEPDLAKPLLVFIDNPHSAMEYMHAFLTYFAKHEETFHFLFLLFERESRYWDAEDATLPLRVRERDSLVIINNKEADYQRFREETREVFAKTMELDESRYNVLKEISQKHENIAVSEVLTDYLERVSSEQQRHFDFEWQDLENFLDRKKLNSFQKAYTWTALVYMFGFPLPVSLLKRLSGLETSGASQYLDFAEMIERSSAFENFPLLLEGGKLRTRHESIAGLFVKRKMHNKVANRLWEILETIDLENEDEKSIFSGLIFHKKIVRDYLSGVEPQKVDAFASRFALDHPYYRNVMMMKAWLDIAGRRLDRAGETLAAVLEKFPGYLPAYTELGKIYSEQKKYDEARHIFEKLLQRDKRNLHARTELSKIYQYQKKWDEAEKVLLEALAIDKNQLHPRTELSKIYQELKRWDEAEKVLLVLLDLDKKNLQARTELSKIYQELKRWDEAEKVLLQCLEIVKDDLNSRLELSKVYQRQKRLPDAEKILLECIRIKKTDLNSRLELSKIYQKQNKVEKAIAALKELLELDKGNIRALTELGKIYQKLQRWDEAEKYLRECLTQVPGDLNSRTELSKIYQRLNRDDDAERVLSEILEIDEDNLQARTELSKIYQRQKKYDEAERVLSEILEIDEDNLQARTELSKIYQRPKRYDEAERVLLEILEIDKDNLQARTELSKIYQRQKRYDEAEKVLLKILEIDEDNLQARTELSKIYQRQKRYDEAERVLLESLKIDKNQLHPRTELSKIYQLQEKWDEAIKYLNEYIALDPKGLHPRTELSKIYQRLKRYDDAEKILKELLAIEPDSIHGYTEMALLFKQWAADEKRRKLPAWWTKKQLYYTYIKESYRLNPYNLPTLMELCSIFSTFRQYRAGLYFLEKALSAQDNDLETLRHLVLIYHTLNHETEVARLLEKGRLLIQEQSFIKYKDRFQALDLNRGSYKKLLELNNTGAFSSQVRDSASNPAPTEIQLGSERFALMEKYTAHYPIADSEKVFFATYQVGEKVYADFIEPYFQDVEELAFFKENTKK